MLHQRYIWNISKNDCNSDQQWLKILDAWNYCLYFKWNEDGKLDISYEKKNDSLSNYVSIVSVVSVPTIILVSSALALFATIVVKNTMSRNWCHRCMLSPIELEICGHKRWFKDRKINSR